MVVNQLYGISVSDIESRASLLLANCIARHMDQVMTIGFDDKVLAKIIHLQILVGYANKRMVVLP